jgi:hypothetical protein
MSDCTCPDLTEFVPKSSFETLLEENGKLNDKIIELATTGTATQVDARSQACALIPANNGQVTIQIPSGFTGADMFGAPLIQRLSGTEEMNVANYSVDGDEITYDLVGEASVAGSHKICQSFSKLS